MAEPQNGSYVGVFMVELPPDWWLPEGYSLTANGAAPMLAWDPTGQTHMIYPVPGYRPPPARVESIAEVVQRELGPVPVQGFAPETREALGMNRNDLLGAVNRTIMAPMDVAAMLLDLASYGIDATVVAGTEGASRAGWMSETSIGQLRRDLRLLSLVAAAEAGASSGSVTAGARAAQFRVAAGARALSQDFGVLMLDRRGSVPGGRTLKVVDVVTANAAVPGVQQGAGGGWLRAVLAGQAFDKARAPFYQFNQLYVTKRSGQGY